MARTVCSVAITILALLATLGCFLANVLAFATPYWIMAKVTVRERRKFDRLGLWTACFNQYSFNQGSQYRETLTGCHWLDSDYFKNSRAWLIPDWFISVQVLSTAVSVMLLIANGLLINYFVRFVRCYSTVEAKSCTLKATAVLMFLSGLIETVVVVVFGVKSSDRDWLPRADLNYLSVSFRVAVTSAFFAFVAGTFLVVAALSARRRRADLNTRAGEREYAMSDRNREYGIDD